MLASRSTRSASRTLRSWSKKKRASASRAPQHALVALDDRRGLLRLEIADDQEPVDQLAGTVGQREVLLVLLHRQDEAFLRHFEERVVERAGVDGGPFDQRRHLVQQRVRHQDRGPGGRGLQCVDDPRPALGETGDHLAFGAQRFLVGVGRRDVDARASQETMAVGRAAGDEAERAHRHDVGAVKRKKPVRRANKFLDIPIARGPTVGHDLRDRQCGDGLVQRLLQTACERLAFRETAKIHIVGLAVGGRIAPVRAVAHFGRRGREMRASQRRELLAQRLAWLAVRPECDLGRHELLDALRVWRDIAHGRDRDGQSPRRRIGCRGRAGVDVSARSKPRDQRIRKRRAKGAQRLRRQFFREELYDKPCVTHGFASRYCAGSVSRSRAPSIGNLSALRDST